MFANPIPLGIAQARSFRKATAERESYQITWVTFRYRLHGTEDWVSVPVAYVSRVGEPSRSYSVTFRPGHAPRCSCPSSRGRRGTNFRCKHAILAEKALASRH